MNSKIAFLLLGLTAAVSSAEDAASNRMLFDFSTPDAMGRWQAVNDGVMGGRSDGRFKINSDKRLEFFGNLSLANNGGFASIRSRNSALDLQPDDEIVLKVRGDGREYTLNLYTPQRRTAFSYRAAFKTQKDEWTEVSIPLSKFVATSFGRVVPNMSLRPADVNGIGVLLGDKKPGPFKLEIESISVKTVSE